MQESRLIRREGLNFSRRRWNYTGLSMYRCPLYWSRAVASVPPFVIMDMLPVNRGDPPWGWLLARLCRNDAEEVLFTSAIVRRARWLEIAICCHVASRTRCSGSATLHSVCAFRGSTEDFHKSSLRFDISSRDIFMFICCGYKFVTSAMEQSPSWEAVSRSVGQKFPVLLWDPSFHFHVHNSLLLDSTEPDDFASYLHSHSFKKLFILPVSSSLRLWSFPFGI
jgi:hypothetical protein